MNESSTPSYDASNNFGLEETIKRFFDEDKICPDGDHIKYIGGTLLPDSPPGWKHCEDYYKQLQDKKENIIQFAIELFEKGEEFFGEMEANVDFRGNERAISLVALEVAVNSLFVKEELLFYCTAGLCGVRQFYVDKITKKFFGDSPIR